jgi:hypothetical protein
MNCRLLGSLDVVARKSGDCDYTLIPVGWPRVQWDTSCAGRSAG